MERRNSQDNATVKKKAITIPRTGDTTMKINVVTHFPGHTTATIPAFATAAPA
jgi:hypothetical protein